MSSKIIYTQGRSVDITIPAGESIAVMTKGTADVFRKQGYPNVPATTTRIGTVINGQTVFGPYASGATIVIDASAAPVEYAVGVGPLNDSFLQTKIQPDPGVLNATGTLTAAMIGAGIVTSTTAAAVTATLDTGSVMDLALDLAVNESFDWSAINTGGANAFTVTASSGHTIVGSGTVAASTSAKFRTRKTAASTFVTYRM